MLFVGVQIKDLMPYVGTIPTDAMLGMQTADGDVFRISPDQIIASTDSWSDPFTVVADTTVVNLSYLTGKTLKAFFLNGSIVPGIVLAPTAPVGLQVQFDPSNGNITRNISNIFSLDDVIITNYTA